MIYVTKEFIEVVKKIAKFNDDMKESDKLNLDFVEYYNNDEEIEYRMIITNNLYSHLDYNARNVSKRTGLTWKNKEFSSKLNYTLKDAYIEEMEEEIGRELTEEEIKTCEELADKEFFEKMANEICEMIISKLDTPDKEKKLIITSNSNEVYISSESK